MHDYILDYGRKKTHNVGPRGDGDDFPILVFEGLEKPRDGQTDEEMIKDLLTKATNITAVSVHRAIRCRLHKRFASVTYGGSKIIGCNLKKTA